MPEDAIFAALRWPYAIKIEKEIQEKESEHLVTFGILQNLPNNECPVPLWIAYGIPKRFETQRGATVWAREHLKGTDYPIDIRDIRVVFKYTKLLVEVYSGRIKDGVIDESRPTYESLLPSLIKSYQDHVRIKKEHRLRKCVEKSGHGLGVVTFKKKQ